MPEQAETWTDIAGHEGSYKVSSLGRIRSLDRLNARGQRIRGRMLSLAQRPDGHSSCGISKDGRAVTRLTHRLVAIAFVPNPDDLPEVGHEDGDRTNNRAENLYWTDHGDFIEAAYACHSRGICGAVGLKRQDSPCAKLTEAKVIAMRKFFGTHLEAAAFFGVSRSLAQKVRRGVLWPPLDVIANRGRYE